MSKKRKSKDVPKDTAKANGKPRPKDYDKQLRKLQGELLELQRNILAVNERLLMLTDVK